MRVTWIGHSTVLLELDGVRLLTDPLLRPRVAHLRRIGAAVEQGSLGELDAVLISHGHYDHLDLASLRRLGRSVPLVVPRGLRLLLRSRGFRAITELDRGDATQVGDVVVRATEAKHPGARPPWSVGPALGFLVSGSTRTYFAGDTDLFDGMSELAPGLDVALLPVAGWGPRLPPGHLDPRGAARAAALLRPRVAVPIHWGTYRRIGLRGDDAQTLREPPATFAALAGELAPEVDVRVLAVGGSLELAGAAAAESED